jgi:hypothetical protein
VVRVWRRLSLGSASSQIFIVLARVQPWADCGNELDYSQYELLLTLREGESASLASRRVP